MNPEQLGPYRIVGLLGRGGMGAVYRGVHVDTDEPAAIKVLAAGLADEEGFRQRFEAEIETLRKLYHPNIVQLFGFGEQDGVLFYAMELVEGSSLEEELRRGRRFEWREVARLGIQICRALRHAHDRGVVHRDIKPANLLLSADGRVKLSDFGIARLFGYTRLTAAGSVLGTVEYMAPEQADGRAVGPRADLYSLGGVFFALLARRPPFRARSLAEMLEKHRTATPEPVRRFAPETPVEFECLIAELLEKDPNKRVANATLVARRLEAMLRALGEREPGLLAGRAPGDSALPGVAPGGQAGVGGGKLPPTRLADESPPASLRDETPEGVALTLPAPTMPFQGAEGADAVQGRGSAGPTVVEPTGAIGPAAAPQRGPEPADRSAPSAQFLAAGLAPTVADQCAPVAGAEGLRAEAGIPGGQMPGPAASLPPTREASAVMPAGAPAPAATDRTEPGKTAARGTFVALAEGDLDRYEPERPRPALISLHTWVLVIALLALGGGTWYLLRPLSADDLYERIARRTQDKSVDGYLREERQIDEFLSRFPTDPRAEQLRRFRREIELYRLQRKLELRAKGRATGEGLLPIERAYIRAINLAQIDPEEGLARLEALLDLYKDRSQWSGPAAECLELARRHRDHLRRQLEGVAADTLSELEVRLARAEELEATDPGTAAAICRAVIVLYQDKAWAAEAVHKAQQILAAAQPAAQEQANPAAQRAALADGHAAPASEGPALAPKSPAQTAGKPVSK